MRPKTRFIVVPTEYDPLPMVNSGVLVFPSSTAPADRARATAVASLSGTVLKRPRVPQVVRTPAVSSESFTVMGTPCSGPRSTPLASDSSAALASASARSNDLVTTALRS